MVWQQSLPAVLRFAGHLQAGNGLLELSNDMLLFLQHPHAEPGMPGDVY